MKIPPSILQYFFSQYRLAISLMLLLTVLSSLLGVGVLAFINQELLVIHSTINHVLLMFSILLMSYFFLAVFAQMLLTRLGHYLVYELLMRLIKEIMNSRLRQIALVGKGKIIASLSHDIQAISMMFIRMPELIQGSLFILVALMYLCYLSFSLFVIVCLWLFMTLLISYQTVRLVYRHLEQKRHHDNELFKFYHTILDGHKELTLNRFRAQHLYHQYLKPLAKQQRFHTIWADNFHALAGNITNVMLLAAIGLIFYLAYFYQYSSIENAITISITLLFIRAPLLAAIGAYPTFLQGKVALKVINQLKLNQNNTPFIPINDLPIDWKIISLENISYGYENKSAHQSFQLAATNLQLYRGEVVFLVGKNGSGKSTLALLLSGLIIPTTGCIYVDNIKINDSNRIAYQQYFSSVFSDFYLFSELLTGDGFLADIQLAKLWLHYLQIEHKTTIKDGFLSNQNLSLGQRKRLALLVAIVEKRSVLILDEWAADQDPHFRKIFYESILPLLKKQQLTIFAISHDDKYFHLADRVLYMNQGQLTTFDQCHSHMF